MQDIKGNINYLKSKIPESVKLVAVSKTMSVDIIMEAYQTGQRVFGENRVQEILNKKDQMPADTEWHLIGHLQTNKIKYIVSFISMIQSVDSFRLLKAIDYEASKINKVVDCLLQMHIAKETSKFGFSLPELLEMLSQKGFKDLKNIRICGVMGMATFTSDKVQVAKEFAFLKESFNSIKDNYFPDKYYFSEISMGMSDDYQVAIENGSTIVRIGSLIFGNRVITK